MTKRHKPGNLFAIKYKKNNYTYGILLKQKISYNYNRKIWKGLVEGKLVDVFVDGDIFIVL